MNMAISLLAAGASVPSSTAGGTLPITIPQTPANVTIASVSITLPVGSPATNRVALDATIGVAASLNVPQIQFSLYRDGLLLFTSQQGLQNGQEQFYCIRTVTADFNVAVGTHNYSLVVTNLTSSPASVAGPITLSALAFG